MSSYQKRALSPELLGPKHGMAALLVQGCGTCSLHLDVPLGGVSNTSPITQHAWRAELPTFISHCPHAGTKYRDQQHSGKGLCCSLRSQKVKDRVCHRRKRLVMVAGQDTGWSHLIHAQEAGVRGGGETLRGYRKWGWSINLQSVPLVYTSTKTIPLEAL